MSARASTNALITSETMGTEAGLAAENTGARVIAVTSGKGGVGKTNITANLGISLAAQGKKVCVFDADTSLANINILLGLTPDYTLEHLLSGEKKIEEILLQGPGGLEIIPAASGIMEFVSLNKNQQKRLLTALKRLSSRFDYLLIDTAAGISEPLLNFLQAAPYTIMTITPEPTSLTDAFSLLKVLKQRDFTHPVFVIVNMAPGISTAHEAYKRFRDAVAKYLQVKVFYLGHILSDGELSRAVIKQKPVILQRPFGLASRCIKNLGERLERTLTNQAGENSDFCSLLDELLPVHSEADIDDHRQHNLPQAALSEGEKDPFEEFRQYLGSGQASTEEIEALLTEMTNSWIARFGHPPPGLAAAYAQATAPQAATAPPVAEPAKMAPQPQTPSHPHGTDRELAELQHAMHYARLLARSERRG